MMERMDKLQFTLPVAMLDLLPQLSDLDVMQFDAASWSGTFMPRFVYAASFMPCYEYICLEHGSSTLDNDL